MMKVQYINIIIAFLIGFFPILATAQQLTVIATSSNGFVDTLVCGFTEDASLGIDTNLGEYDLSNEPINGFEGRILQRNEMNYQCAVDVGSSSPIFYEDNFDSKTNIRDINNGSIDNKIFELQYFNDDVEQLTIIGDVNLENFLTLMVYAEDCTSSSGVIATISSSTQVVTFGTSIFTPFKEIILKLRPEQLTRTDEVFVHEVDFKVYPNPTKGIIHLEFDELLNSDDTHFELYDVTGQLLFLTKLAKGKNYFSFDFSNLSKGIYFYKCNYDKDSPSKGKIILVP